MLMTECWTKVSSASAFLPVDNWLSPISAFRHQVHGIVRHCPAMLHRNKKNFMLDRFKKKIVDFESAWKVAEKCVLELKNPNHKLFRKCFGLFHETKTLISWCVSVFRTCIKTTETKNLSRNKQKKYFVNLQLYVQPWLFYTEISRCSTKLL
jgi:hypothetical protein